MVFMVFLFSFPPAPAEKLKSLSQTFQWQIKFLRILGNMHAYNPHSLRWSKWKCGLHSHPLFSSRFSGTLIIVPSLTSAPELSRNYASVVSPKQLIHAEIDYCDSEKISITFLNISDFGFETASLNSTLHIGSYRNTLHHLFFAPRRSLTYIIKVRRRLEHQRIEGLREV